MKLTNGKKPDALELFEMQKKFQYVLRGKQTPVDDLVEYSYHIQAMVEELGELVKADKRWKTLRNSYYDINEKLDELADVYITIMNIVMYSGFTMEELLQTVKSKIHINEERTRNANNS